MFARLHGIEAVTLRYSNVYGPRQNPKGEAGVVAIFTKRLLAGEPLVVYGDGEQTRDMVFVGDVAAANVVASLCAPPSLVDLDACAFNVGTGIETSVNRLAAMVSEVAGHAVEIRHAPDRPGEIRRNALISDKAARDLGWRPQIALMDGLRSTARWLANRPTRSRRNRHRQLRRAGFASIAPDARGR
jgi:UDP-glucose 4-epimerase